MVTQEKLYTAKDLWVLSHLPENEGKHLELSEGMLIEMSPAGGKHGGIAMRIAAAVFSFVNNHQLGHVTAAETGYILFNNPDGKDTVRAPDVGFITRANLPKGLPDGYVPAVPDLAVEVVSPGDDADEVQLKVSEYLKHGTKLVWVAYPKSKTVMTHTKTEVRTLSIDDTLDGGDVLTGFMLPVKDIFPES